MQSRQYFRHEAGSTIKSVHSLGDVLAPATPLGKVDWLVPSCIFVVVTNFINSNSHYSSKVLNNFTKPPEPPLQKPWQQPLIPARNTPNSYPGPNSMESLSMESHPPSSSTAEWAL
jgi:hypothetical protein